MASEMIRSRTHAEKSVAARFEDRGLSEFTSVTGWENSDAAI
jgi:hypothetical protein